MVEAVSQAINRNMGHVQHLIALLLRLFEPRDQLTRLVARPDNHNRFAPCNDVASRQAYL